MLATLLRRAPSGAPAGARFASTLARAGAVSRVSAGPLSLAQRSAAAASAVWGAPALRARPVAAGPSTAAAAAAADSGLSARGVATIGSAAPVGARRTLKGKIQRMQKGRLNVDKQKVLWKQLPPHSYGLMALEPGKIRGASIEALRRLLTRALRKSQSVLSISMLCDTPVTKKPLQSRMGKGKGAIDHWVARIASGTVLFFFQTNLAPQTSLMVCTKAQSILRVKTRIVHGTNTTRIGDIA